jgi:hypothetical protein
MPDQLGYGIPPFVRAQLVDFTLPDGYPHHLVLPNLRRGDRLTVERTSRGHRPGELIAFRERRVGALTCQFVLASLGVGKLGWYALGDDTADERFTWVGSDRVIGRVLSVEREGRPLLVPVFSNRPCQPAARAYLWSALRRYLAWQMLRIHVSLQLERALGGRRSPPATDNLVVREVSRAELEALLDTTLMQVRSVEVVDRLVGSSWRAFVAFVDSSPVHHSFVHFQGRAPKLLLAWTAPGRRREGAFQQTVEVISEILSGEGYATLASSCAQDNHPSVSAHLEAGFVVKRTRLHPWVGGRDLVGLASRGSRALRRRMHMGHDDG